MTLEDQISVPCHPYNEAYYAQNCGASYDHQGPIWEHHQQIAQRIFLGISPSTVLDVGCAKGFLIEGLRKQGVEAWGVDISEYAISSVVSSIQPYCRIGTATITLDRCYDLIVCIEVLEHLSLADSKQAIQNFCQHTKDVLFSSSPFDFTEPTHINVQAPRFWANEFAQNGFFKDRNFDLSIITPWAVRFCKMNRFQRLHNFLLYFTKKVYRQFKSILKRIFNFSFEI